MKVSPTDIRRKEFKRSVRGYLEEDVDVFLDTVADGVEALSKENTSLQERVQALEEQVAGHTHIREALEKTLVAAQLQSEEIRSKAEKESQSIVQDAESKARAVVEDLYSQTRKVQQTLMQLKLLEEDFRFKFRALLEGYLKLVEDSPILLSGLQRDMEVAGAPEVDEGEGVASTSGSMDDATSETMEISATVLAEEKGTKSGKVKESKSEGTKAEEISGSEKAGAKEDPADEGDASFSDEEPPAEARDFKW